MELEQSYTYGSQGRLPLYELGLELGATVFMGDEVAVKVCVGQAVLWMEKDGAQGGSGHGQKEG